MLALMLKRKLGHRKSFPNSNWFALTSAEKTSKKQLRATSNKNATKELLDSAIAKPELQKSVTR